MSQCDPPGSAKDPVLGWNTVQRGHCGRFPRARYFCGLLAERLHLAQPWREVPGHLGAGGQKR